MGVGSADAVIEVGPGLGDLTTALASQARRVLALEIDHGLVRALADAGLPGNVEIRQGDALDADWASLADEVGAPVVLVGNLPYRVAGRLIALLLLGDWAQSFRRMGFMVQTEVAERLVASPATAGYASLAVWARLFSSPRRALELGPDAFVPRPKVHSTFVLLDPPDAPPPLPDRALLERVVTLAFRFRRKTLRRALDSLTDSHTLVAALAAAAIDGRRRGETLSELEFVGLTRELEVRAVRVAPEAPDLG